MHLSSPLYHWWWTIMQLPLWISCLEAVSSSISLPISTDYWIEWNFITIIVKTLLSILKFSFLILAQWWEIKEVSFKSSFKATKMKTRFARASVQVIILSQMLSTKNMLTLTRCFCKKIQMELDSSRTISISSSSNFPLSSLCTFFWALLSTSSSTIEYLWF